MYDFNLLLEHSEIPLSKDEMIEKLEKIIQEKYDEREKKTKDTKATITEIYHYIIEMYNVTKSTLDNVLDAGYPMETQIRMKKKLDFIKSTLDDYRVQYKELYLNHE